MYIASQKRKENIAEYLLYMWQIEDLIRANDLDIVKIEQNIIDRYNLDENHRRELKLWYESLIDMMRTEGVTQTSHLQINKNTLAQLVDFHRRLLADPRQSAYHAQFYKALPFIVELRAKAGEQRRGEIETCFTALYGTLLMKLRGQALSKETQDAMGEISKLIAMLAAGFHQDENNPEAVD